MFIYSKNIFRKLSAWTVVFSLLLFLGIGCDQQSSKTTGSEESDSEVHSDSLTSFWQYKSGRSTALSTPSTMILGTAE